jgi:hypothetical protein
MWLFFLQKFKDDGEEIAAESIRRDDVNGERENIMQRGAIQWLHLHFAQYCEDSHSAHIDKN